MRLRLGKYLFIAFVCVVLSLPQAQGSNRHQPAASKNSKVAGSVYPQFKKGPYVVRWLAEQMPLKVYVAHGQSVEKIIDPNLGASAFNVDNLDAWPDIIAQVIENQQVNQLPVADGFLPEHYQAAVDGISSWKAFEKEGLFSIVFTDDPSDADIYVFWVDHFVNKLGLGLFANDIRGYTAKYCNWYKAILDNKSVKFKPVISLLRTTDQRGQSMPIWQMQASAAHEFGHALGIDQHSPNPHDLMSLYYGNGKISANDAATIRYLYHLTPDLVP